MKIKKYESDQYAGTLESSMEFSEGMNVVLGDNEAGKSTMISAIYNALLTPYRIDKRKNRDFISKYFPASGAGDIDVSVSFEADGRDYKITKEWSKDSGGTASFTDWNKTRLKGPEAENRLKEVLSYGQAFYDNLVFGRQDNRESVLDWCFSFFSADDDNEVREALSRAVSAAGGISRDRIVNEIKNRMEAMSGHWDFHADRPENNRGIDNPWKQSVGSILRSYYEYRKELKSFTDLESTEQRVKDLENELSVLTNRIDKKEKERTAFNSQHAEVTNKNRTEELVRHIDKELKDTAAIRDIWTTVENAISTAKKLIALREEKNSRAVLSRLEAELAERANAEEKLEKLTENLRGCENIEADYKKAEKAFMSIEKAKATLNAAGLTAEIHMQPPYKSKISGADGNVIEVADTAIEQLDGYIHVDIQGVAEFSVYPSELDIKALKETIHFNEDVSESILAAYNVADLADLETKRDQARQYKNEEVLLKASLNGMRNRDEIDADIAKVTVDENVSVPEDIDEQIRLFVVSNRASSLEGVLGAAETEMKRFRERFTSAEEAGKRYDELAAQAEEHRKQLDGLKDIRSMSDEEFNAGLSAVEKEIEGLRILYDEKRDERSVNISRISDQSDPEEIKERAQELKKKWESQKQTYLNYGTILKDIEELSAEQDSGMGEFLDKFNSYLSIISNSQMKSDPADELDIVSGRNRISDKILLSAGSRNTLILAFRLALIDTFYPQGGGLIVLDDDLLDLDPGRRKAASELLADFSERNQVIFTTCDPSIADLLGGNRIDLQSTV